MGFMDLMERHREIVLYVIFGGFTVLVSWATYALFVFVGIDLNISNVLSWICAVTFAFGVNKWFVFLSKSLEKDVLVRELVSFFSLRIVTGLIAVAAFPALIHIGLDQSFFSTEGFVAKVAVTVLEIVLNYLASKFIVFRSKKEDA